MYHFEKKNFKIFFSEGPHENVWGPCKNVSPGPAVALDRPASHANARSTQVQLKPNLQTIPDAAYCVVSSD